jgi:hypothetical protein
MDRAMSDTNPFNDDDSRSAVDRAGQSKHWMGDWNVDGRTGQCGSDVRSVLRRRVRAAPPGPGVDRLEDLLDGREYRPAVVGSARGATRGVNPRRFVVVSSDPGLWCAVCGLAVRCRLPKR